MFNFHPLFLLTMLVTLVVVTAVITGTVLLVLRLNRGSEPPRRT